MRIEYWYVLLLIPPIVYLFLKKNRVGSLKFSNVELLKLRGKEESFIHRLGKYLILIGIICLVAALARPRIPQDLNPIKEKGIDIAMLLDVSGSMQSVDFEPSRLHVAKNTIQSFIKERLGDRIALVVFGGNAYTRIPLTLDHEMIDTSIQSIDVNSVREEGTAIGMAISVGLNRLKKSDSKSKVMILVTDGDNNAGAIDPVTASSLAKDLGVKIYTIGVGTDETIIPYDYFGTTRYQRSQGGLNEELLMNIAETTGGSYYRAKNSDALANIFDNINQLEKSNFDNNTFRQYNELGFLFMKVGLLLIIIGLFMDRYCFIRIP